MSVYDNNDNVARFAWQQNNAAGFSNTLGSTILLTMVQGGSEWDLSGAMAWNNSVVR